MADGTTRLHRLDGSDVFAYLGVGTFGERTVVPATAAIPVSPETAPEVAALIGCCVSTGIGSVIHVAGVPEGSTVAVIGLGGVGLSVIMGAVLAGAAKIIAIDRVPAKLERALAIGATDVVAATDPSTTESTVLDLTDGGVDFAFEAIGMVQTIEQSVRLLRPGGTAVVVGMTPTGQRASFDTFDLADRSMRIVGSNYGSTIAAIDFPRYAALSNTGRLPIERLIDGRIGPAGVNDALAAMRRGETVRRILVRSTPA
jgi:S-(hydroxymethyl)glutathione dehydrogenase / alcohol dehydrogenase